MTTIAALAAQFFDARAPRKHSPHTLDAYRRDIDAIAGLLDVTTVEQLTIPALRTAFGQFAQTRAEASIARCWSTWNQLLGFAVAEQHLAGNPMPAVAKPKPGRHRPKPITGDDSIARLLALARRGRTTRHPFPERDYALLVVALTAGLRLQELCDLNVASVDGPEGGQVIAVRGKGNKDRTVPIEAPVEVALAGYQARRTERWGKAKAGDPLFVDNQGERMRRTFVQYMVRRLYVEAGIAANVPAGALVHALRHTCATAVARAGATGTELQRLLGHESLATTQRYVDATGREIRAAGAASAVYDTLAAMNERSGR